VPQKIYKLGIQRRKEGGKERQKEGERRGQYSDKFVCMKVTTQPLKALSLLSPTRHLHQRGKNYF
jgi:hypothetical protein